jgi:hypothetical protein
VVLFYIRISKSGKVSKIDADGLDIAYLTPGVGFDNSVYKVVPLTDNKTMAFGSFTRFNGVNSPRIARLLEDGTLDVNFNSSASGPNNIVRTAVVQKMVNLL